MKFKQAISKEVLYQRAAKEKEEQYGSIEHDISGFSVNVVGGSPKKGVGGPKRFGGLVLFRTVQYLVRIWRAQGMVDIVFSGFIPYGLVFRFGLGAGSDLRRAHTRRRRSIF